jgi:hypothetical protein
MTKDHHLPLRVTRYLLSSLLHMHTQGNKVVADMKSSFGCSEDAGVIVQLLMVFVITRWNFQST